MKVTGKSMIIDGQMVLDFDNALEVEDISSKVYPEVVFDFDAKPLIEESMGSNSSLAILGDSIPVLKRMKDKSV